MTRPADPADVHRALEDELERVRRERDEALGTLVEQQDYARHYMQQRDAARAEAAMLREALDHLLQEWLAWNPGITGLARTRAERALARTAPDALTGVCFTSDLWAEIRLTERLQGAQAAVAAFIKASIRHSSIADLMLDPSLDASIIVAQGAPDAPDALAEIKRVEAERVRAVIDNGLSAVGPIPGDGSSDEFRRGLDKGISVARRWLRALDLSGGEK
jgi:hypothetical protein